MRPIGSSGAWRSWLKMRMRSTPSGSRTVPLGGPCINVSMRLNPPKWKAFQLRSF